MVSLKQFVTLAFVAATGAKPVSSISCNGKKYSYDSLAGFGSLPSTARDQHGDTMSIGSSMAITKWKRVGPRYEAIMYGLPDRGWNTNGTQNTIPRVHILGVTFTPSPNATLTNPAPPNLIFTYKRTILLSGPDGKPLTGLDPDMSGGLRYPGFPTMPAATYPGDGFGGAGPGDRRLSLDAEGLVVSQDGSFWISDEYGPFIYHFDASGRMKAAIQPPAALLPMRNGTISFNSNTPPIYDPDLAPQPANPNHGRSNNQGFEGLTVSPDGNTLWVMLQSATRQEGGAGSSSQRRMARLLRYGIKRDGRGRVRGTPFEGEWVVPLPTYVDGEGQTRVAAQSEIHYVSETQFLVLARDSDAGRGQEELLSRYRSVDVIDISGATNIKGPGFDGLGGSVTHGGISMPSDVLVENVVAAEVCPFIDYNVNEELGKFTASNGDVIHNGAPVNLGLLNEKWEALALVPVNDNKGDRDSDDEYYLITLSDNDFITDKGFANFGKIQFADDSATVPFLDSQALVFRVTLPKGSCPLIG